MKKIADQRRVSVEDDGENGAYGHFVTAVNANRLNELTIWSLIREIKDQRSGWHDYRDVDYQPGARTSGRIWQRPRWRLWRAGKRSEIDMPPSSLQTLLKIKDQRPPYLIHNRFRHRNGLDARLSVAPRDRIEGDCNEGREKGTWTDFNK